MDVLTIILWSIIVLVPAIYFYFQKKYSYWKDRNVPCLETRIPYGTLWARTSRSWREYFALYYELKGKFIFAGGYNFVNPIIVALDLDFIKDVLIRNFNHFPDHGVFTNEKKDPLSQNLFNLDGQKWKALRHKLSPTFTSGRMKFMFPTVVEVAGRFTESLSEIIETDKTVEVKDLLARFTTDIIGTCAFGINCNSLKDPNAEFRRYGRKHIEVPVNGQYINMFISAFPNVAKKLGFSRTHSDVTKFFLGIVRETVDHREKNNIRRNDFMDLLIQLKNHDRIEGEENENSSIIKKLTFEELAAQAFVFFLGGFETSSSTLTFTLYELALNQELQDKCREEINQVLKNYDGKLTYEAMNEMTIVERIIMETLRKYPILPLIFRKSISDYKVPGTNITIQKGTPIQIPVFSIHHDPEYYPDPEKFDPDRFTTENINSRHPMTFLSFGDGPRNCIGLRFGKMQSNIGLITLLKNYRIKVSSKTKVPIVLSKKSFLTAPEGGMYLDIEKL